MKRFFTLAAAALMTSAFASSAFAGWGPNGQFGNPVGPPVGQSSTPSTNRASAPILNPPDPTKNLGAVPGGYKDSSLGLNKAQQAARIAKAKANFDKKQYSPRLAPENFSNNMSQNNSSMKPQYTNGIPFMPTKNNQTSGYGNGSVKPQYPNGIPYMPTSNNHSNNQTSGYGGNNSRGGGFFGNDVLSRGQSNNYPQYPTNNYPTNNYPTTNNYPSKQSQFPMGGYGQGQAGHSQGTSGYGGQSSSSGWGGYGGNTQTSGYGGASSNSGYGMFAR